MKHSGIYCRCCLTCLSGFVFLGQLGRIVRLQLCILMVWTLAVFIMCTLAAVIASHHLHWNCEQAEMLRQTHAGQDWSNAPINRLIFQVKAREESELGGNWKQKHNESNQCLFRETCNVPPTRPIYLMSINKLLAEISQHWIKMRFPHI